MEIEYVQNIYNKIAKEFDVTRINIWQEVNNFIQNMEIGKLVADIGCGNGKNMCAIKNNKVFGCDFSIEMVKVCQKKKLDVVVANNLSLPFQNETFDYVLSVAVIHHLSTFEKRTTAFSELMRILKPGGLLYIQVWYDENFNGDRFVRWKTSDVLRYYYMFSKDDFAILCKSTNGTIIKSGNDHGNLFAVVQK